jgi:hypothetical protein
VGLYLVDWLADAGYDPEHLATDHVYARRAVLREWLRERGRPARTAEIVESMFEIPEGSGGFQSAVESVSEALAGYEPIQRVGR